VKEICHGCSAVAEELRTPTSDWNPVVHTFVFFQVTSTPVVAAAAGSPVAPRPSMSRTEELIAIASGRSRREVGTFTRCPRILVVNAVERPGPSDISGS
jgi:hypothetical protein